MANVGIAGTVVQGSGASPIVGSFEPASWETLDSSSITASETSCPSPSSAEPHPVHDGPIPARDVTENLSHLPTTTTLATKRVRFWIHGLARSAQPSETGADPRDTAEMPHTTCSDVIEEYTHAPGPAVTRWQPPRSNTPPGDVRTQVVTITAPLSNPVLISSTSDGDAQERSLRTTGSPLPIPHSPVPPAASMRITCSPSPRLSPFSTVETSCTGAVPNAPFTEPLQRSDTAASSAAPADPQARAHSIYPAMSALPTLRPRETQSATAQRAEYRLTHSPSGLGMIDQAGGHHLPDGLFPSVTVRPFRAGAQAGYTRWYKTSAPYFIVHPPTSGLSLQPGDLFVHEHPIANEAQIWLWSANQEWVKPAVFAPHPTIADRFLSFRTMVEPSWVRWRTICTYKSKDRLMQVQFAAQVSISNPRFEDLTHEVC